MQWAAQTPSDWSLPPPLLLPVSPQKATWSSQTAHHRGLGLKVPLMWEPLGPVWSEEAAWSEQELWTKDKNTFLREGRMSLTDELSVLFS